MLVFWEVRISVPELCLISQCSCYIFMSPGTSKWRISTNKQISNYVWNCWQYCLFWFITLKRPSKWWLKTKSSFEPQHWMLHLLCILRVRRKISCSCEAKEVTAKECPRKTNSSQINFSQDELVANHKNWGLKTHFVRFVQECNWQIFPTPHPQNVLPVITRWEYSKIWFKADLFEIQQFLMFDIQSVKEEPIISPTLCKLK